MRRLRIVILAAAMSFCVGALHGQHYLGVRGGIGTGNFKFVPKQENKSLGGLPVGGLAWKYYSKDIFVGGFEVDFLYIEKGYQYLAEVKSDTSVRQQFKALQLPVLWQPHFYFFNRKVSVFANAGPYVAMFTEFGPVETVSKREGVLESIPYTFNSLRDNRFEYGLTFGGGASVLFGRWEALVDFRWDYGLSDVFKNFRKYDGGPMRSSTDQMNVNVGLLYRLGRRGILAPAKREKMH